MTESAITTYTIDKAVEGSFESIVDKTTDALADEGFGVLCNIGV